MSTPEQRHPQSGEENQVDSMDIEQQDGSPHTQQSSSVFIDALPYIDRYQDDEDLQEQVQTLLNEEMSSMRRTPEEYLNDYLTTLPDHQQYERFETPSLAAAFHALSSGQAALHPPLDMSRYKVEPPSTDGMETSKAIDAWKEAIDNAQAQMEHQRNRALNLELLKKYGAAAWRTHNEQLTHLKEKLTSSLSSVQSSIESINRKRKSEQVTLGNDLQLLHNGVLHLTHKNHEIEAACWKLRQQLETKGLKPCTDADSLQHPSKMQRT